MRLGSEIFATELEACQALKDASYPEAAARLSRFVRQFSTLAFTFLPHSASHSD